MSRSMTSAPTATAPRPKTLDYLAGEFADSGYDVKWLFRAITATEMYQLPSSPRRGPEDPPMQHNVAQRLRADQVFDNLLLVLEASEPAARAGGRMGPAARFAARPAAAIHHRLRLRPQRPPRRSRKARSRRPWR